MLKLAIDFQLNQTINNMGRPRNTKEQRKNLTKREVEVLQLVYDGLSNKQIAKAMYIEKRTVDNYINYILKKTNKRNRVEAIRWGFENNILVYTF